MGILGEESRGIALTRGERGGSRCCRRHGHQTARCRDKVTGCILCPAHSWTSHGTQNPRQQDLASEREERVVREAGSGCLRKLRRPNQCSKMHQGNFPSEAEQPHLFIYSPTLEQVKTVAVTVSPERGTRKRKADKNPVEHNKTI